MVEIATSRSEVIDEIITRVKQMNPTASIIPGTPLYDLLVYHFADVITEERELVNIATNIARVSPMFGDDGKLKEEYADMDTYLTDRFFLTRPEYNEVYDTLYLKFSKATGVNILAGSSVYYNSVKLAVLPTFISSDSPLWKKAIENGKPVYLHPVNIDLASNTDTFIPATNQWVTGGIKISTGSRVFILGAESKKAVNTYVQPEVTLEYLRDSISNRSLSNARSILYNLRNSLGFNPDKLVKARVMHTMEPEFIERRKILFSDPVAENTTLNDRMGATAGGYRTMSAVVSGDGKILLDYGVSLQTAPVDAVHIDRSDPLYSELNPFIEDKNPNRIVQEINLNDSQKVTGHFELRTEIEGEFPEQHTVYYITATVTSEHQNGAVTEEKIYTGTSEKIYETPGFERIWLKSGDADASDKPEGWVSIDCQLSDFQQSGDKFITEDFVYHRDIFMLYRIDTRGLALLSPVSIGDENDMTYLKSVLESVDVNDLLDYGSYASISYPGSTMTVHQHNDAVYKPVITADFVSDDASGSATLNNVFSLYSDKLYWEIVRNTVSGKKYVLLSTDPTFKDKGYGAFYIPVTSETTEETIGLDCKLGANITLRLKLRVADVQGFDSDDNYPEEQYFTLPAAFVRNSNRYLVFAVNPNGVISDEDYQATLLYYGTEPSYMNQAQELYLNKRLAEIGNRIIVAPFRPIVFTAYWGPEYVTQYLSKESLNSGTAEQRALNRERYDTLRSQFIELQAFLEDYMSDFSGNISELDFAEMVKEGQTATGLILKRLDYTLFTQRGYPVRGVLDINLDQTCRFDWNENVTKVIFDAVDDKPRFIDPEREYNVTSEDMYRPLFSRVGV